MTSLVLGNTSGGDKVILSRDEQRRSLYVIGQSGTGKSTLLLNMIKQTIDQQVGMCLIDPHGSLINQVIAVATPEQRKRIILVDITDEEYCAGINLYSCPNPNSKKSVNDQVQRIMLMWDKLFHISTKEFPQISEYMRQSAHTIVVNPGYTMAEVYKLFRDKDFRDKLLQNVTNQSVKEFWADFDAIPRTERDKEIAAVRRRLSEFLTDMVLPIVGQSKATIDFHEIMEARPGKILLVKLDRNQESVSSLIGSMIISLIRIEGFSREPNKGKHFLTFSDEWDKHSSSEYQTIVQELRKYAVACVMSSQDRFILDTELPEMKRSTLGTNIVVFTVNPIDAEAISGRFDTTPISAETRRESVLVPKRDVINHLLHQGHTHEWVTDFVSKYLWKLYHASQENLDYTRTSGLQKDPQKPTIRHTITIYPHGQPEERPFCEYAYLPDELKKTLDRLNELFYLYNAHTSVYKNLSWVEFVQKEKPLKEDVIKGFSGILGFYHYAKGRYDPITEEGKQALIHTNDLEIQSSKAVNAYVNKQAKPEEHDEQMAKIREQEQPWYEKLEREGYAIIAQALHKQEALDGNWKFKNVTQGWFSAYQDRDFLYHGNYKDLPQDVFDLLVETIFQAEKKRYTEFNDDLSLVHPGIAAYPIMGESGNYEEKPVAQQTHADRQKEIANMLSNLPIHTAYTRIADKEHTITLQRIAELFPRGWEYPGPNEIKQAKIDIVKQNLRDGYIRKRSDVEKEIAARQQPAAQVGPTNPPPVQKQQKVVSPVAAQAAPIPRKRAIITPVGKQCPDCNVQNSPTANFCQGCGRKL